METERRDFLREVARVALGAGIGVVGLGEAMGWGRANGNRNAFAATRAHGLGGVTGKGRVNGVWEIKTDSPMIALTFDDGPCENWTTMVLDILERYDTPA